MAFRSSNAIEEGEGRMSYSRNFTHRLFAAKDIAAIENLMAPDALLLSPGAPAVQGAKAIAETWKGWSELANVEVTFGAERIEA